jgi:hypothetical protein
MTALFKVTLRRGDVTADIVFAREPRRLPVVLSPEEVARLLVAAPTATSPDTAHPDRPLMTRARYLKTSRLADGGSLAGRTAPRSVPRSSSRDLSCTRSRQYRFKARCHAGLAQHTAAISRRARLQAADSAFLAVIKSP